MLKTIAQAVLMFTLQISLLVGLVVCVALHIFGITS